MSGISLTASMRSNLLSLQNIASRQDIVQNRLATGLKVSSAIDNPSSYYTASSLNNRAADLTALLDSMSQGIQTIKAASEAIDAGTKFLEQAKAVANQTLENPYSLKEKEQIDYSQFRKLDKSWYEAQAGTNGAVVETAQELKDAVAAGKETIVVYGSINFSENENLTLKANQKLVGTEYFADIDSNALYRDNPAERFSQLNFEFTTDRGGSGVVTAGSNLVSDLKVSLKNKISMNMAAIYVVGADSLLKNLDIRSEAERAQNSGILVTSSAADTQIKGVINIDSINPGGCIGLYVYGGNAIIDSTDININSTTDGMTLALRGKADISNSKIKLVSIDGISTLSGNNGGSTVNIKENVVINAKGTTLFRNPYSYIENPVTGKNENAINLAAGTQIYWQDCPDNKYYNTELLKEATISPLLGCNTYFRKDEFQNLLGSGLVKTIADYYNYTINPAQKENYSLLLSQYDTLISDAFYKGVNLLTGQNLKINFNEDRSSKIDVAGVKADSDSLGLKTKEWKTTEDIEKSVSELEEAINSLRSFASAFGNYYSIVTTRQDFTENLINVLEEGADKLTLADMNQESANMLALQTSQQLAVNSLSLASQASQAVLRLF